MKRLLAALLLAMGVAGTASADTEYWVKAGVGVDNTARTGADSTTNAWATLAFAMTRVTTANAAHGDVTIHCIGDVSGKPWADATNAATDGKRYYVTGRNIATPAPGNASIPGVDTRMANLTISGVTIKNLGAAGYSSFEESDSTCFADSVANCVLTGGLWIYGDYNVIRLNTFNGVPGAHINIGSVKGVRCVGTEISYNNITLSDCTTQPGLITTGLGSCPDAICDSLTWKWNTEHYSIGSGSQFYDHNIRAHYLTLNSTWKYNKSYYDYNVPGGECMVKYRDACYNNFWNAESIYIKGAAPNAKIRLTMCCNGNHCGGAGDQVRNWSLDSCLIYNTTTLPALEFYSGVRGINMTYCTLLTAGNTALVATGDSLVLASTFDHNTIVGNSKPVAGIGQGPIVDFSGLKMPEANAVLTFTNNLIANKYPTNIALSGMACGSDNQHNSADIMWSDIASVNSGPYFKSNYNAYDNVSLYGSLAGDRSISFHSGGAVQCSAPGDNKGWDNLTDLAWHDSSSVAGRAAFGAMGGDTIVTNSLAFNFDPHIDSLSVARAAGSSSSDIGAVAFARQPSLNLVSFTPTRTGVANAWDLANYGTNASVKCNVVISNTGSGTLTISSPVGSVWLGNDSTYTTGFTALPASVGPFSSTILSFTYATGSTVPSGVVTYVNLLTNDPRYPTLALPVRRTTASGGGTNNPDVDQ